MKKFKPVASNHGMERQHMPGEFEIIRRYFKKPSSDKRVLLGIGDDAAVVKSSGGDNIVVATDLLVAGRHFPKDLIAGSIGHRVLAVNLSDLAAMSAVPHWALLQLSVEEPREDWLSQFSEGLFTLADRFDVSLIGGDTVRGAMTVGMTVLGEAKKSITRAGARADEVICVSGTVGDASLGLRVMQGKLKAETYSKAKERFLYPEPRVKLGLALAQYATAMIDISDGLLADLEKLLVSSRLGANVEIDSMPFSPEAHIALQNGIEKSELLNGGDDYELCFTLKQEDLDTVSALAAGLGTPITPVGYTCANTSLNYSFNSEPWAPSISGFDHFGGK